MPPADIPGPAGIFNVAQAFEHLDAVSDWILARPAPCALRYLDPRCGKKPVVFVAHNQDVVEVLTNQDVYSVSNDAKSYLAIAPGSYFMLRPPGPELTEHRDILFAAEAKTPWFEPDSPTLAALAKATVDEIIASLQRRSKRRFDLISEYAFFIPYLIAEQVFGMPGPSAWDLDTWLICQVFNAPYFRRFRPDTGPRLAQLTWSQAVLGQLFADYDNSDPVMKFLGRIGATCFRAHATERLRQERDRRGVVVGPPNLLQALLMVEEDFPKVTRDTYDEHIVSMLVELMGTAQLIPALAFANLVAQWKPPGPHMLVQTSGNLDAYIDRQLSHSPPTDKLFRTAERVTRIGDVDVEQGDYVCALLGPAGRAPGSPPVYVHFGPNKGPHHCLGRHVAHAMLKAMLAGLGQLPDLSVASSLFGPSSFGKTLAGPGRLMVRFS